MAFTLPGMARAGSPLMVRASEVFSKPVSVSSRFESWKMKPRSSRRNFANWRFDMPVISRPPTMMCPLVTVSMVETQFKSVVLPEPEGPMMPTNSPAATSKLTPASAWVTESRLPKTFSMERTERMGEPALTGRAAWGARKGSAARWAPWAVWAPLPLAALAAEAAPAT